MPIQFLQVTPSQAGFRNRPIQLHCISVIEKLSKIGMHASLIIAACLVPIIIKVRVVPIPEAFLQFGYPHPILDGFSFYKAVMTCCCAVCAFTCLMIKRLHSPLRVSWVDGVLGLIAGLVFISTILSPHKSIGIWGVPFIFEGLPTVLAYLVLASAAMRMSPLAVDRFLPLGLAISAIVISILSLAEQAGFRLLDQAWIARWILNISDGWVGQYNSNFNAATIPFGNPNYAGMYAAMVWPFFVAFSLIKTRMLECLLYSCAAGLVFALLFSSMTRAAFIAGSISVSCGLAWCIAHRAISWHSISVVLFAHIIGFGVHCYVTSQPTRERIKTIADELHLFYSREPFNSKGGLSIEGGRLRFDEGGGRSLLIERQLNSIRFMDAHYRPLAIRAMGNQVIITDNRYSDLKMQLHDFGSLKLLTLNSIKIGITHEGFRILHAGTLIRPKVGERFPLPMDDKAFSHRGFIWSRTLPLLKDKLILGSGAGSFPFEFPNDDVFAMTEALGANAIVDKPHNLYLSYAHSYGIVTFGLMLVIFFRYSHLALNILIRKKTEISSRLIPYFLAFLGFVISAISNDSTVGVATPFWVLLGAGLGLLTQYRDQSAIHDSPCAI